MKGVTGMADDDRGGFFGCGSNNQWIWIIVIIVVILIFCPGIFGNGFGNYKD
jgi:hypothetical protein